jgi:hypothetical protein
VTEADIRDELVDVAVLALPVEEINVVAENEADDVRVNVFGGVT